MIKCIDLKEREEFISTQDTTEPKTVFVLKPLSSMDRGKIITRFDNGDNVDAMFATVAACLVEIRNGDDVVKDITEETLKSVPLEVVIEIHNRILDRNTLLEQDRKN